MQTTQLSQQIIQIMYKFTTHKSKTPNIQSNRSVALGRANVVSCVVGVQLKLDENRHILDHGAHRSQQPRNGVQQVFLILRKGNQADAICAVSYQRQQEEEKRQTLARLFAVVLDNLGDSRTNSLASTLQR